MSSRRRRVLETSAIATVLAAMIVASAWQRWAQLASTPFPVGVDGYFYATQLRSLLETGELAYPAAPLAFWLLAPFAAATDPIVGVKLGAALLGALGALPAYAVGARLSKNRGAGVLAAALLVTSEGSVYLTNEFVKNGIGLTLALAALWLVLRALESPIRRRVAGALLGCAAALLAHKMAAALVAAVAVPAWLATAGARGLLRGRRLLYAILICVAGVVTLLVLGIAMPERFLSATDAALVANLIGDVPHWDAPALVTRHARLTLGHEALVGAILAVLAMLVGTRRGRAVVSRLSALLPRGHVDDVPAAATGDLPQPRVTAGDLAASRALLVLALALALPWLAVDDAQGLGFRLRIAAFVPMALAAAILAGRLLFRITHREAIVGVLAALIATRTPPERPQGRVVTHPALVTSALAMRGLVPAEDIVVVPERHILYMVAWYTGARVRLRPERVPHERRWRLVPLAFIGAGSPLDEALMAARAAPGVAPPRGLHPRHPNGLVLIPEATWQWMLAQLPPGAPARWRRWQTI